MNGLSLHDNILTYNCSSIIILFKTSTSMSGRSDMNDFQISKTLSWLLRHGALKEKLPINSEGFININALLNHRSLAGKCTIDDIKRIVANNDKQRFALRSFDNILEIRANQGHSVNVVGSLDLKPITDPKEFINIIHGTYYRFWNSIKTNGLSRMNRNHIHFASGLPTDKQVISGMRNTCDVYIYVNPSSILSSGIKLFCSANGVILSPGNEKGVIEPKHFLKVIDSKTGIVQTTNKKEIIDFFSQYGQVVECFAGTNNRFAIIQFAEEKIAREILQKRVIFKDRYLHIKPRVLQQNKDFRALPKQEPDYEQILETIRHQPDFDNQLSQLMRILQTRETYSGVCKDLERCLQIKFSNCRVWPFGSTVSGLGFINSDIDIYVEIVIPLNISSSSDSDSPATVYTRIARSILSKNRQFSNVIAIPKAKTPIVRLVHHATGIYCDINFKNFLGVCNSNLIKFFTSLDRRIRPFMFFIKYWAKVHEISGSGKICNYGIIMLAIFYLQQPPNPVLPPIELFQIPENYYFIEGWNGGFSTNPEIVPDYCMQNNSCISELLYGFFNFLAKFDYGFNVICPLTGRIQPKSDFSTPENLPESFLQYKININKNCDPLKTNTIMCLQDPFELSHNITACIPLKQFEDFIQLCKISADVCNSSNNENILPKLLTKQQIERGTVATDINCEFKITGTFLNITNNEPKKNDSKYLRQLWFDKVQQFLVSVLSKLFLFEVTINKCEQQNKAQKLAGQSDIHDTTIVDTLTFHCVGYNNVWEARKGISKNFTDIQDKSILEQEIVISDYIVNVLCKDIKVTTPVVDFNLTLKHKINPTEAEFLLSDINSRKNSFRLMANFFARKYPYWFDQHLKELQNSYKNPIVVDDKKVTDETTKNVIKDDK